MAAAGFAPLAIALRRFVIRADVLCTPRNLHAFRLPQGEGIDGTGRPMAARTAMTIAHACRLAGHGEPDRATETTSIVAFWAAHNIPLCIGQCGQAQSRLLLCNPTAQFMGPLSPLGQRVGSLHWRGAKNTELVGQSILAFLVFLIPLLSARIYATVPNRRYSTARSCRPASASVANLSRKSQGRAKRAGPIIRGSGRWSCEWLMSGGGAQQEPSSCRLIAAPCSNPPPPFPW